MIRDSHAVVTGAGRGIGAAIAAELASRGAKLTLMGRTQAPMHELAERLAKAHGVEVAVVGCDVSDEGQIFTAFRVARETFGPPHILVNNAGQADGSPVTATSRELWDRMLAVNLTGAFLCIQQVLPAMIDAKAGRIVNIASVAGLRPFQNIAAYAASKHGLLGLTKVVALETAKLGITVNAVCPGYTDTALAEFTISKIQKRGLSREEAERTILRTVPRGTLITPEEVASMVGWLCSDGASGISGEAIVLNGGDGS